MDTNLSMLSVEHFSLQSLPFINYTVFYLLMVFQLLHSLFSNTQTALTIKKCILPNFLSATGNKGNLF